MLSRFVALPVSLTLRVSLLQDAGHSHLYAVTWPMLGGAATQKNYSSPMGTIYSEMRKQPLSFWRSQPKASKAVVPSAPQLQREMEPSPALARTRRVKTTAHFLI